MIHNFPQTISDSSGTKYGMLHAPTASLLEAMQDFLKKSRKRRVLQNVGGRDFNKLYHSLNENNSSTNENPDLGDSDSSSSVLQCLEEMKEWMDDLGIREIQKEEINIDYRRKYEDKIYELKDTFNGLSIEIWKIIDKSLKRLRELKLRARIQKIIIDDDDDNLEFYAVHPRYAYTSPSFAKRSSLGFTHKGDGLLHYSETETISVETPCFKTQVRSYDFSLGECNLLDIDEPITRSPRVGLIILLRFSPGKLLKRFVSRT
ncbi:hypothetical protein Tco_1524372 [Tanacetum coccineum]